jgi:hypothetical protein
VLKVPALEGNAQRVPLFRVVRHLFTLSYICLDLSEQSHQDFPERAGPWLAAENRFSVSKSRQSLPFNRKPAPLITPAVGYSVNILEDIVRIVENSVPLNSIWQRALKFFKSAERHNDGLYSFSFGTWCAFAN